MAQKTYINISRNTSGVYVAGSCEWFEPVIGRPHWHMEVRDIDGRLVLEEDIIEASMHEVHVYKLHKLMERAEISLKNEQMEKDSFPHIPSGYRRGSV